MESKKGTAIRSKLSSIAAISLYCISYFLYIQFVGLTYPNAIIDTLCLLALLIPVALLTQHIQSYFHASSPLNIANISYVIFFSVIILVSNHFISINLMHSDFNQVNILRHAFIPKTISILFLLFLILIYFWSKQQKLELIKSNQRAIEKERESLKIELNSLQQQFKPHFLFNSLNSINALTLVNPEEARKMIHLLSDFMRGSIRENENEFVSLEEEIGHLKLYTDIEKVRFGDRLKVTYNVPKDLWSAQLPHLILQPMIENAIKYGLYGHVDEVNISINAKKEGNNILITMTNPFDKTSSNSAKGTGYGLLSIEKKMQILYNQYNLLTIQKTGTTYSICLTIPQ